MALVAWNRELGTAQGRIKPQVAAPIDGDFVFCLGAERANVRETLQAADYVQVSQTGTFAQRIVRFRMRTIYRAPPAGFSWRVTVLVDGSAALTFDLTASALYTDQAVPCVAGAGTIAFRLTLIGTVSTFAEVELPAVMVDGLVEDASPPVPAVYGRRPEPSEADVPGSSSISLIISDLRSSYTGIHAASTMIFVNGVLAVSNGTFQSGFNGPGSSWSLSQPHLRVTIDPTTNFASQATPVVRVVSATVTDLLPLDTSYTFAIADTTPPFLAGVVAMDEKTLRFTFSESVDDSALVPGNYSIVRQGGQVAVAVSPVSVMRVSSLSVDVTANWELTPQASYLCSVSNVFDIKSNAIGTPNSAVVYGASCPVPDGRRFVIADWIPDMNWAEDDTEDLKKFIAIIQEIASIKLCEIDRFTSIIDPDLAPIKFVEAMLQDLGNPFGFTLTDIDKRRLAQVLWSIYRQKGTGAGIVNAIRFFLGLEVTVEAMGRGGLGLGDVEIGIDWILGSGALRDWYGLTIVSPIGLTEDQREKILIIANYMRAFVEWITGIEEPEAPPAEPDHLELSLSELGVNWTLH